MIPARSRLRILRGPAAVAGPLRRLVLDHSTNGGASDELGSREACSRFLVDTACGEAEWGERDWSEGHEERQSPMHQCHRKSGSSVGRPRRN